MLKIPDVECPCNLCALANRGRCALWHSANHLGVISECGQSIIKFNTISPLSLPPWGGHFCQCSLRTFRLTLTEQKERRQRADYLKKKKKKVNQCGLRRKLRVCNGLTAEGLASPFVRVTRLCKVVPSPQHPNRGGRITVSHRARRASSPRSFSHHPVGLRPAAPSSHTSRRKRQLSE